MTASQNTAVHRVCREEHEDDLDAAKGIINGLLLSVGLWSLIGALIWWMVR